jgi:hypothetical protein
MARGVSELSLQSPPCGELARGLSVRRRAGRFQEDDGGAMADVQFSTVSSLAYNEERKLVHPHLLKRRLAENLFSIGIDPA